MTPRPVSGDLALLATFFNLVPMALEAVIQFDFVAALFSPGKAEYLRAFTSEQLSVMTHMPARLCLYGFGISLMFFACYCLVMGYLMVGSGYLSKALGVLLQIAGFCYLMNSFALNTEPI